MKASFYNIFFENDNHKYVYNTLTTGLAELDDDTYSNLKNNVVDFSEKNLKALMQAGYLVDDSEDEYNKYLYFYNSVRFGRSASTFVITFVPTYGCNLACPYCMQGQDKNPKRITDEGVNSIVLFCEKQIAKTEEQGQEIKQLYVNLFGGEPTLYKDALFLFCRSIKRLADEKSIPIAFLMTSNFTMIDDNLINFIDEYDISVQITIDGTPEQHDKRRITKTGLGTYETIISNLQRIKDRGLKSKITIRINLDKDNVSDAEAILKKLMPFSDDIYFGYLDNYSGKNDDFTSCIDCNQYATINTSRLDDILRENGFLLGGRRFGKQAPCSINSVNKFFVDCNLDVYKCDMLLNNPKMRVGTIGDDGSFSPEAGYYYQMNISPEKYPRCRYCKLLPLCGSGCAGKSYFRFSVGTNQINKENCSYSEEDLVSYLVNYVSHS